MPSTNRNPPIIHDSLCSSMWNELKLLNSEGILGAVAVTALNVVKSTSAWLNIFYLPLLIGSCLQLCTSQERQKICRRDRIPNSFLFARITVDVFFAAFIISLREMIGNIQMEMGQESLGGEDEDKQMKVNGNLHFVNMAHDFLTTLIIITASRALFIAVETTSVVCLRALWYTPNAHDE